VISFVRIVESLKLFNKTIRIKRFLNSKSNIF
jgi:hypothetical protein